VDREGFIKAKSKEEMKKCSNKEERVRRKKK
jgi:hypothetical protein